MYQKIVEEEKLFSTIFDMSDEEENRHFELLRKAYIEARYSKTYSITKKELQFLEKKILSLKKLVLSLCKAEIEE